MSFLNTECYFSGDQIDDKKIETEGHFESPAHQSSRSDSISSVDINETARGNEFSSNSPSFWFTIV